MFTKSNGKWLKITPTDLFTISTAFIQLEDWNYKLLRKRENGNYFDLKKVSIPTFVEKKLTDTNALFYLKKC